MTQYHDLALLLVRLAVGYVFIYHGLPKLRKPEGMSAWLGWPKGLVMLLGLVEILAGLGIILGAWAGLSSIVLAIIMVGATYTKIVKGHVPFSAHDKTGWEYDLVLFVVLLFIAAHGPSEYSLMM